MAKKSKRQSGQDQRNATLSARLDKLKGAPGEATPGGATQGGDAALAGAASARFHAVRVPLELESLLGRLRTFAETPSFAAGLVVTQRSMVIDDYGEAWWVDPEAMHIRKITFGA